MPTAARPDPLERYRQKRDFSITPEPGADRPRRAPGRSGGRSTGAKAKAKAKAEPTSATAAATAPRAARKSARRGTQTLSFVIQKHWASHLHYDFRLELDGVLLSWAVPKGPSFDPKERRMAIHVEDHPLAYGGFEGTIPAKQYGAGEVIVWDNGTWEPQGDAQQALADGKLVFRLHGQKLAGLWQLVRTSRDTSKREQWLLIKKHDEWERPHADYDVTLALPDSVLQQPLGLLEEREGASANPSREPNATDAAPDLSQARKAKLPATLSPQLAMLVTATPAGEWVAEAKFDGYRLMARIERGQVRLITRGGNDWTDRMASLAEAVQALGVDSGWLDGEIVMLREDGTPDFNALQNAIGRPRGEAIVYFLFDVPFLNGHDLRQVPLRDRRTVLRELLNAAGDESGRVRFSEDFAVPPEQMLAAACQMRLEGLILKRPDAPYTSDRSESWVKLKCQQRQEFVVAGYTDRSDGANALGSLLLGYFDDGQLRYAGRVGTGWSLKTAGDLRQRLRKLAVDQAHFSSDTIQRSHWARRATGDEHWVKPEVVVEVAFAEWTPDGHIRHASFQGIREDKPAREIGRESAKPAQEVAEPPKARGKGARAKTESGEAEVQSMSMSTSKASKAAGKTTAKTAKAAAKVPAKAGAKKAAEGAPMPAARAKASTAAGSAAASAGKPTAKAAAKSSGKPAAASDATAGKLKITHPERVIDPSTGLTKIELVRYYESVVPWLMPHLAKRPVALVRAPDGIDGQLFFQKHVEGDNLIVIDDAAELLHFTQMNAIELHTWNAQADKLDKPDRVIFDLDPGEGVPFSQVREAALVMRALLRELGLQSWLKTSGGKGLHVVVPLARRLDNETCKGFSQAVVQHLASTLPKRFSAKSGPRNRVGKIFPDYLRNGEGQTTAAAFSARSRPGLGVSMPIDWDELAEVQSGAHWTIVNARDRLSFQKEDPWKDYWTTKQTLTQGMKLLGL